MLNPTIRLLYGAGPSVRRSLVGPSSAPTKAQKISSFAYLHFNIVADRLAGYMLMFSNAAPLA